MRTKLKKHPKMDKTQIAEAVINWSIIIGAIVLAFTAHPLFLLLILLTL